MLPELLILNLVAKLLGKADLAQKSRRNAMASTAATKIQRTRGNPSSSIAAPRVD
jgi:hypothetical protein